MGFIKNIRSAFARKQPVEATGDTETNAVAEDSTVQTAPTAADPPTENVVYIYSHGFTNGVYRIEPDKGDFERFLEYCNKSDKIREQQLLNKRDIAAVDERLNREKIAHAADSEVVVEKGKLVANLSQSIGELEQSHLIKEQDVTALVARKNDTVSEYAWIPALLFFFAGIIFIAADISITKQITSWGFNMSGLQGWLYAIGLAFTAFLIKPAIDRMLEKPFQSGGFKLKALYKGFLIGITILGLIMLWLLGEFRADSERARGKLDALNAQMGQLDPRSAAYKVVQDKSNAIQSALDDNFMGQNGLVLSGLLFAIGGAICLSVSFGSLKQLINRYWLLPMRIGRIRRGIRCLDKKITGMRTENMQAQAEQEKAAGRILVSEVVSLKEELSRLRKEEEALLTGFYEAQYEREKALYRDGRSRGEKYTLDGDLLYKASGSDRSSLYVGKQSSGADESQSPAPSRPYTRRPFVKMRKMIADHFNKNQNSQTYDGTEFEIVS